MSYRNRVSEGRLYNSASVACSLATSLKTWLNPGFFLTIFGGSVQALSSSLRVIFEEVISFRKWKISVRQKNIFKLRISGIYWNNPLHSTLTQASSMWVHRLTLRQEREQSEQPNMARTYPFFCGFFPVFVVICEMPDCLWYKCESWKGDIQGSEKKQTKMKCKRERELTKTTPNPYRPKRHKDHWQSSL